MGIKRLILSLFLVLFLVSAPWAATYYVDATNGDDQNSGTSQDTPWKTINKVNTSSFSPGDSILFKRGETWREQLNVPSSGSAEGGYLTFGAYGEGDNPKIRSTKQLSGTQWSRWSPQAGSDGGFEHYAYVADNRDTFMGGATYAGTDCSIQGDQDVKSAGFSSMRLTSGGTGQARYTSYNRAVSELRTYNISIDGRADGAQDNLLRVYIYDVTNEKYLKSDGDWQDTLTYCITFNGETPNTWVNKNITFDTLEGCENLTYRIINQAANGTSWADNVIFGEPTDLANRKIWYGKGTFQWQYGASKDGTRVPRYSYGTEPADMDIDERFNSRGQSPYYLFYYRNDAGNPGTMEVGDRTHAISIDLQKYIIIENIDCYGPGSGTTYSNMHLRPVVCVTGTSDNVIIRHLTIGNGTPFGIHSHGNTSNVHYDNLTVYGSSSTNIYIGTQTGSVTNCHTYNANQVVTDSAVNDGGGIGSYKGGNLYIADNICHDNSSIEKQSDFEISVVGATNPVIITRNLIYNAFQGGVQLCEGNASGSEISSNIILGFGTATIGYSYGKGSAIRIGGGPGGASPINDVKIYNNIISGGGTSYAENAGVYVTYHNHSGLVLKNNIFYNNDCRDIYLSSGPDTDSFVFDNNCYYKADFTNNWYWKGTDYSTLAAYRTASGMEANSIDSDPNLINPAAKDFRLNTGSPCIKAGVNVNLSKDFQGNKWRATPSMGAIEHFKIGGIISPRRIGGAPYAPMD